MHTKSPIVTVALIAFLATTSPVAAVQDDDLVLDDDPIGVEPKPAAKGKGFIVIVPELNIFPQPSVNNDRIGALKYLDQVSVSQWHSNDEGQWARVCKGRICGWVSKEFLQVPPSGAE